jgi:nucleotide-binding universal stress UspA family protein
MLPFQKILFPVDYSDACRAVVPFVKATVHKFSAHLTLVHAYGPEGMGFVALPITDPNLPTLVREFEQTRLREFAQEFGLQAEVFVDNGEPSSTVRKAIERYGCDLIMLPTHGRGPIRRMLLGSVAAKLLHDASCAVWTAAPSALASHADREPMTILCAVDDTDEASAVIKAGAVLANTYNARLHVVQVVVAPPLGPEMEYVTLQQDIHNAAQDALRDRLAALGVSAPFEILDGYIPHRIQEWASAHQADLIVTGRGTADEGLSRVWSHLYAIVREAPCPVLSI